MLSINIMTSNVYFVRFDHLIKVMFARLLHNEVSEVSILPFMITKYFFIF